VQFPALDHVADMARRTVPAVGELVDAECGHGWAFLFAHVAAWGIAHRTGRMFSQASGDFITSQ
jgi:hypothetical protein